MSTWVVREYVGSTLLPALGISGDPFTVMPPSVAGTRSSLFLVRAGRIPPLLLRAFERRRQAARNVQALRHLEELRLPAPRLVFHDLSWSSRWLPARSRTKPFVTVETWIEGSRVSELDDQEIRRSALVKVALLLSHFRDVTRPRWGRPASSPPFAYMTRTLFEVRLMTRAVRSRGWFVGKEARAVREAFASWRKVIGELKTFSLVHKDANPDNFILTPTGEVVPVDLHRIAYGPFPEEVVTALDHLCPDDQSLTSLFLETYFARGNGDCRSFFEATRGFFEPLYFLKKLYRRATRTTNWVIDAKVERWRRSALAIRPPGAA